MVFALPTFLFTKTSLALSLAGRPLLASLATILIERPQADPTGVSDAFLGIARLAAGMLVGILTIMLVAQGYQYLMADETSRGVYLKRGIGILLCGAILVIVAVTLAPQLINAIVSASPSGGGGNNGDF